MFRLPYFLCFMLFHRLMHWELLHCLLLFSSFCRFSAPCLILTTRLFSFLLISSGSSGTFSLKLHIFPAWAVHLTEKKVSDCVGSLQFPFLLFSLHHCVSDVTETLTSHSKGFIMPWPHQKKMRHDTEVSVALLSLSLSLSFVIHLSGSAIYFFFSPLQSSPPPWPCRAAWRMSLCLSSSIFPKMN